MNKRHGTDCFHAELYKTFKKEVIPICITILHKIETEETLSNSFYEAIVTLIPKPLTKFAH